MYLGAKDSILHGRAIANSNRASLLDSHLLVGLGQQAIRDRNCAVILTDEEVVGTPQPPVVDPPAGDTRTRLSVNQPSQSLSALYSGSLFLFSPSTSEWKGEKGTREAVLGLI